MPPKNHIKEPTWDADKKLLMMHLMGRPVPLLAPSYVDDEERYNVNASQNPPLQELHLEWIYGYRGRDTRSNIFTLGTGELMYPSAGVVIMHNIAAHTQRHYMGHTNDITCIAMHPDKMTVASGQTAGHEKVQGKPHVRIWETVNLTTLHVFGEGKFQSGICCVSFSQMDEGKHLMVVDESNFHILSVWDVSHKDHETMIVESKTSGDPVTQCEFHPSENIIVCCGKAQITFWSFVDGKLSKKSGTFLKYEKPKVVNCFCFTANGDVITGDSSGNLYVWKKGSNEITNAMPLAHKGPVFYVCCMEDGHVLSGGGKDNMIYQYNSSLQKTGLQAEIPKELGGVRVISIVQDHMVYVGTIRNCILQSKMDLKLTVVVEGHKKELWGLETLPGRHQFLTCGYDSYIYLWDATSHSVVWRKEIAESAHCCTIHPKLDIAAIGLLTGKWIVMDLKTQAVVAVYTDGKEAHECIQYSPDGTMLAVGNHDNFIYVYEVSRDGRKYNKLGCLKGHSSFVTHIDWSTDGEVIRSNSGDYEILYWWAKTCQQEVNVFENKIRDIEWATQNCTLSFNTAGIWPGDADGTDVNSCSVSHRRNLLVSADDFGKLNLYRYPCSQAMAEGHEYGGHSSHVTNAKFLFDDSRVITTGGNDWTIMQWKVIDHGISYGDIAPHKTAALAAKYAGHAKNL